MKNLPFIIGLLSGGFLGTGFALLVNLVEVEEPATVVSSQPQPMEHLAHWEAGYGTSVEVLRYGGRDCVVAYRSGSIDVECQPSPAPWDRNEVER